MKNNFWKNKKVFLTGHTGFKGSWLTLILNSLGAKVYGYALNPISQPNFFQSTFEKYVLVISKLEDCFESTSISKESIQKDSNEKNGLMFKNIYPKCEPNLGKRGLYDMIGAKKDGLDNKMPIFWVLNFSDGENSLLDISQRSKIKLEDLKLAAERLVKVGLIQQI